MTDFATELQDAALLASQLSRVLGGEGCNQDVVGALTMTACRHEIDLCTSQFLKCFRRCMRAASLAYLLQKRR